MTSFDLVAEYLELPLDQQESTQEILKLAHHLNVGKNVKISYKSDDHPRTILMISASCFTNGTATKIISNCMQLFTSVSTLLNYSKNGKFVRIMCEKKWLIKTALEAIRAFFEVNAPSDQFFLTPFESGYSVCKITQVLNYFHSLTGPQYSQLAKWFEKEDDLALKPIDQQCMELLRLVAPSRDVEKDTHFMWQVAPLSGVIDSDGDEDGNKSQLIIIRDRLLKKNWIQKIEGNYEVTDTFKDVNVYSITELI